MFIQNEFDPLLSYSDLEKVLKDNNPPDYHLAKNPNNNTHDYEDYETLTTIIKEFFA